MKRLFLAIKLIPDDNLLKVYYSLKKTLRHDKIRWVDPGNFHLTLKFFGNTSEDKIDIISDIINDTIGSYGPINIKVTNIGVFGSSYKPRVIWFGISNNETLVRLGIDLLVNLDIGGFHKDRQNFVPHFTIGRITKITDKQAFNNSIRGVKDLPVQQIIVDRLVLYESILSSKGAQYNEINSFFLSDNRLPV